MSNKNLFSNTNTNNKNSAPSVTNASGNIAYARTDEETLAQLAVTGCFSGTFYTNPGDQFDKFVALCDKVSPEFVAKLAIYCRRRVAMKDTPAVLTAYIAAKHPHLLPKVFHHTIDNLKMVRNFVQIIRSGKLGRKSLGSAPKRMVANFLNSMSDKELFSNAVGNNPSIADIISLSHPRPATVERAALYAYLLDKKYDAENLPQIVKDFEEFKENGKGFPNVGLQRLMSFPNLSNENWKQLAKSSTWNQLRLNLNNFERHGVFDNAELTSMLAEKLASKQEVTRSQVFPYQVFSTYMALNSSMPKNLVEALNTAMECSVDNIPEYKGKMYVLIDVSGSMGSAITGSSSKTTVVRNIDVAAVIASALQYKNKDTEIYPFDTRVHDASALKQAATIFSKAKVLSTYGGGGTDCACALRFLNENKKKGDVVVFISDNESNTNVERYYSRTGVMNEWEVFKKHNPNAKLINIDITPNTTSQSQAKQNLSVLNVGGFSDAVFDVMFDFIEDNMMNLSSKVKEVNL